MIRDPEQINTTALAFIGDAVYEVYVRERVLGEGNAHTDVLHRGAVRYVKADRQAAALRAMMDSLTEDETALVKRARNHRSASKPKNADPVDYKLATAFEALIGWLHLAGDTAREKEIVEMAFAELEKDNGRT